MTQKQQRETLARFASGAFQVLCATSIAEEDLDVPQVNLVVFYEPFASDVRLIQRKGRTGRDAPGKVIILTTGRTADERYLWAGLKREKRMRRLVRRLARAPSERTEARSRKHAAIATTRRARKTRRSGTGGTDMANTRRARGPVGPEGVGNSWVKAYGDVIADEADAFDFA